MRGTPGNNQVDVLRALIALSEGNGASGTTHDFVYQPGGVGRDNVYTDWAKLIAAVNRVAGMRRILIDGSFASPTVPTGTWAVDNVMFYGETTGGFDPLLTFADGAHLTANALYAQNVGLVSSSTSPVMTFAGGTGGVITLTDAFVVGSASAPFFLLATDAGSVSIFCFGTTSLGDATNPALTVNGAATASLAMIDQQSVLLANATTGSGAVSVAFTPGAESVSTAPFPIASDANLQFPQIANLTVTNWAPTTAIPVAQQFIANLISPNVVRGIDAVQTANGNHATLTDIALGNASTPLPDNSSGHVELVVVARVPSTGQTAMWHAEAAFKKTGGVITVGTLLNVGGAALSLFGATGGDAAAFAGATITVDVVAVNLGIAPGVTGVAPLVIDWTVTATYTYTHA